MKRETRHKRSEYRVEILTIGDEVLAGNIADTNTAYLADSLWQNGLPVSWHSAVRDDQADIMAALDLATRRARLVVVTGGLGPTEDDITLASAAKLFRKKMIPHPGVARHILKLFRKIGREPSSNNGRQALIPNGARVFMNPVGTAPGVGLKIRKCLVYFMPGVPKEMKALWQGQIWPDIEKQRKDPQVFESCLLRCFGEPESKLDLALKDLYTQQMEVDGVRVGFRVSYPDTFIKLSAWGRTRAEARRSLNRVRAQVMERIQGAYYGEGEDTLESVLGRGLASRGQTLALAESCTGGLIAHRITNVSGSSAYFAGGVVSYSNEAKGQLLDVSADTLAKEGAVSHACAREMALGAFRRFKADYALAVTGIAGPTGGTKEKPVGTVYIALADARGVESREYHFPRGRDWFKLMVSSTALNWLRKRLFPLPV